MKRAAISILIAFLLISALTFSGLGVDIESQQKDALDTGNLENNLPEAAEEVLGDVEITSSLESDSLLSKLGSYISGKIGSILSGAVKNAAALVLIALLAAVAGTVYDSSGTKMPDYVSLAAVLAVAAVSAGNMSSFARSGLEVIDELNAFSKLLLPTLTAASTASGALTSAAAKYAATVLFMDLLISISRNVIMPIIYAYIAVSIANAALGTNALKSAAGLIKWIATTMLTLITIAFTAYLLLTGIITGSTDATTTRLAKTAVSTLLPIVGSIISDAAGTVASGISLLKNAIGVFGLIAVLSVCAVPFLKLGANYLLYKAAGAMSSSIAGGRISALVDSMSTAIGMMLGLCGSMALMLFISIISMMRAVTG